MKPWLSVLGKMLRTMVSLIFLLMFLGLLALMWCLGPWKFRALKSAAHQFATTLQETHT